MPGARRPPRLSREFGRSMTSDPSVVSPRAIADVTVIVVTKGRSPEVTVLLSRLARQALLPRRVLVVGTCAEDFDPAAIADATAFECHGWISMRMGTTSQRNEGIDFLRKAGLLHEAASVVFFDDDFRPAADWLAKCAELLDRGRGIHAVTGCVLSDGVHGASISEDDADRYIDGGLAPRPHWASGMRRDIGSLYGCNMGFRASTFLSCRFDEELPLYGWQEDRDITGQVKRRGRVVFEPSCRGVHLGAGSGRSSGLRFGYSQIANLVYLRGKGTVELRVLIKFLFRAVVGNSVKAIRDERRAMYLQRLKGNALAAFDLLRGTCRPRRIIDFP